MQTPVYEDLPRLDWWLKAIIILVLAGSFIPGIMLLSSDPEEAYPLFGTGVFVAALFKAVLPTRYQIFPDRIRVVLGGPFALSIRFDRIKAVRIGSRGFRPTANFITSVRNVLEIVRVKGMAITISPSKKEVFLDQLALYLGKDKIENDVQRT